MAKSKTNQPAREIRIGGIKAVIWLNQTQNGDRHNVQFQRLYRDDGTWKQTDSFGRDDLLVLAKVADLAHTWIYQQSQQQRSEESSEEKTG